MTADEISNLFANKNVLNLSDAFCESSKFDENAYLRGEMSLFLIEFEILPQ